LLSAAIDIGHRHFFRLLLNFCTQPLRNPTYLLRNHHHVEDRRCILSLLGTGANAFAPALSAKASSALASESSGGFLEPKQKVPCFGATPLWTPNQPVFIGENY